MASNDTDLSFFDVCFSTPLLRNINIAQFFARICTYTPLSIFILYHSWQRWWQQRSFATVSHSDVFIYHLGTINLLFSLGGVFYLCGEYVDHYGLKQAGIYINSLILPSEVCFHILTCVERYLAVVHPITYRGLKQSRGIRIRNVSIGLIWIVCIGWILIVNRCFPSIPEVEFMCFLVFAIIVVSFCSFSVLCVLIRPGPGDRQGVDLSKLKAFHRVSAILVVLLLFLLGMVASIILNKQDEIGYDTRCLVIFILNWLALPSGLILPVMFVLKARKQACCH